MIILTKITRGNVVSFTTTPKDVDGNAVSPDAVHLYLDYLGATGREQLDFAMADNTDDDEWNYEWNTAAVEGLEQGTVYWSVRATNPSFAEDGSFALIANAANPDTG